MLVYPLKLGKTQCFLPGTNSCFLSSLLLRLPVIQSSVRPFPFSFSMQSVMKSYKVFSCKTALLHRISEFYVFEGSTYSSSFFSKLFNQKKLLQIMSRSPPITTTLLLNLIWLKQGQWGGSQTSVWSILAGLMSSSKML